jgi:ubiquinone/menaquinone biosynthesis C-methylase UbiE
VTARRGQRYSLAASHRREQGYRDHLQRTYARYGASVRKRRAWSQQNPGNRAIRQELTAAIDRLAGEAVMDATRVLDAGCGTGWWLAHLAQAGTEAELHGIDLLENRVIEARRRVPQAQLSLGDVRALPYPDAHFGAVFLLTVLSSVGGRRDYLEAASEAHRVLAPGGALVVWEPRIRNRLNQNVTQIPLDALCEVLGAPTGTFTLTLVPQIARRLGRRTERLYDPLARVSLLRTHRLVCWIRS